MDSEKLDRILTDAFNERSLAGIAAGIVKDGQLARGDGSGALDALPEGESGR